MKKFTYFKGSCGEALQDSFVLSILDGKKNGWYLEIGSAYPKLGSNTFLLENSFDWRGVSIDFNPNFVKEFNESRKNTCILADATKFDYLTYLRNHEFPDRIDYLQLDIDPASNTLLALKQIPFNEYQFSIVTFEHDLYSTPKNLEVKSEAAKILNMHGYVRVVNNLKVIPGPRGDGNWSAYEDWWVHQNIAINSEIKFFENKPWTSIFNIPVSLKIITLLKRLKEKSLFNTVYLFKRSIKKFKS